VTQPEKLRPRGFWAELFHEEARLWPRIRGVLRLEPGIYAEIDQDPSSIPQAFAVVIGSAVIARLSGSFSPYVLFMSIAGLLFAWLVAAALMWAVATVATRSDVDYARLVRCLGFAYVWVVPLLFAQIPFLGGLVTLASVGLLFYSFVLAARQVIGDQAWKICTIALILPIGLIWIAAQLD